MLAELKLVLDICGEEKFNVNKSSLFHGVIMENIDSEYAEILHNTGLNPFAISLRKEKENFIWSIRTLNKEAYNNIIMRFLDANFNQFVIRHNNITVKILDKELNTKPKSELVENFYHKEIESNLFDIDFLTPTAFKSNGQYVFMPDIEFIYRSIMNKYSASSDDEMLDDNTLKQLVECTKLTRYDLKSVYFNLEGVKIPGFKGYITLRVNGPDTMRRFARLLFEFAEYSGIGIKCSLGMGKVSTKNISRRKENA